MAGWQLNCGDKAIILDYDVIYNWQPLPDNDMRRTLATPCNVTAAESDRLVLFGTPQAIPDGVLVPGWKWWTDDHQRFVTVPCPENGVYLEDKNQTVKAKTKGKRPDVLPLQAKSCKLSPMLDYELMDSKPSGGDAGDLVT